MSAPRVTTKDTPRMSSQLTRLLRPPLGVGGSAETSAWASIAAGVSLVTVVLVAPHTGARRSPRSGSAGAGRCLASGRSRSLDRRQEATDQLVDPVRPRPRT